MQLRSRSHRTVRPLRRIGRRLPPTVYVAILGGLVLTLIYDYTYAVSWSQYVVAMCAWAIAAVGAVAILLRSGIEHVGVAAGPMLAGALSLDTPSYGVPPIPAPRQIPSAPALVVGRDDAIRRGTTFLLSRRGTDPAVVVVHGEPGVGKSVLGVALAHAVATRYPDGQLYARLQGDHAEPRSAADVLRGFLHALPGSPPEAGATSRELRAELDHRIGDQAVLVMLDDAGPADTVLDVIPSGRHTATIITTRDPHLATALNGSLDMLVSPLAEADSRRILDEIAGSDRTAAEPEHVRQIIEHLGGLPIAVRAAAAALAAMPETRLASALRRCEDTWRIADTGPFDFAYAQLRDPERRTLVALGLLDGETIERWQLAELLDTTHAAAMRSADRLCQAGFLTRTSTDSAGVPRYRVHPLILDYIHARVAAEASATREAMVSRLPAAQHGDPTAAADPDQARRSTLDPLDRGAILTAINAARQSVEDGRKSGNKAAEGLALAIFAEMRAELGSFQAAEDLARSAAALGTEDPLIRVRVARCDARLARRRHHWSESLELLRGAIALSGTQAHRAERALCHRDLAVTLIELERFDEAAAELRCADELIGDEKSSLRWVIPRVRLGESLLLERTFDFDASLKAIGRGRRIAEAEKLELWLGWLDHRAAQLNLASGAFEAAGKAGIAGRDRFASIDHRYGKATCGLVVGQAYLRLERPELARPTLEAALETFTHCGDRWSEALTMCYLAESLPPTDIADAVRLLGVARNVFSLAGANIEAAKAEHQLQLMLGRETAGAPGGGNR